MKREIRFRAWDGNRMNYDPSISDGTDGGETASVKINTAIECFDYTLMQFTGLHDKNGKEIYEGDIISILQLSHEATSEGGILTEKNLYKDKTKFIVEYRVNKARYILRQTNNENNWRELIRMGANRNTYYEIIGNIHQNPELLNQ